METITIKRQLHRGQSRLTLNFDYNKELIPIIKAMHDARWSGTMKCWHLPDKPYMVHELFRMLKGKAFLDYSSLKSEKVSEPACEKELSFSLPELSKGDKDRMEEFRKWMIQRRYSDSTIDTYTTMLGHFLRFIKPKESHDIVSDDMVRFVNEYVIPRGLSYTFQNQVISASKLFYNHFYKSELEVETFKRPRREHRLPNVLSKEEVKGNRYSEKSLESVLKQSLAKAGIKKPVTLHWLRHSYATHLLESGTDIRYIQELLGHSSSRTTEIYTHVTTQSIQKIRSPFDDL